MLEWVVRMEYKFTITELTAGQAKMMLKDLLGLRNGVMAWQTEKAVLSCIRSICDTYRK